MNTQPFIDRATFTVRAGRGGDGCTSFRSEPHKPRGGPDGGNGGKGGDVILKADEGLSTLTELNYSDLIEAEDGEKGGPNTQKGKDGDDREIKVPPGTVLYHGTSGEKLGELKEDGDRIVVAEGGEGGRGNRTFITDQRQAPSFHEYGAPGEELPLKLELKLLAEVGLIGAPNAGKSTLLSSLTAATPEIASHPFTTQSPNLGALFRDHQQITICDIPGLVENAHQGAGLGLDFLRHVERTRVLVHVVDLSSPHPVQAYRTIEEEIRAYDSNLKDKPRILALNKIDVVDQDVPKLFMDEIEPAGAMVLCSAMEGTGLRILSDIIWSHAERVDDNKDTDDEQYDRVVSMEQKSPVKVQKLNDRFILQGDRIEELVQRFDLRHPEAQSYVRDQLLSEGVHRKLEAAGCRPGDTIQVKNQVFNYTG